MTEAVIAEVFKRPPLLDHGNEDLQFRGFVVTTIAKITR
jgi:hypothetical protein